MYDYTHSSDLVLSELLNISKNIIWKNPKMVSDNEIDVDSIEVEQYKLAVQGNLTYDLVYQFNKEALLAAGLSDKEAEYGVSNPRLIPENMRERCAIEQTKYIINNYVERNNYYRMLNGLPDLNDTEFFYNTEYPEIGNPETPIHLLDKSELYILESNGFIENLIEKHPEKKYLQYLTDKKISIYTARNSDDYALLYTPKSSYETMLNVFRDTYNSCRQMVMNVYYVKNMQNDNAEYSGFIGMVILFATINQMYRKFLDADISRNFFDEDSLRYLYDSYGVPYYSSIPIQYHTKIVKNINILISHKGSTKVFYDLFNIFGFSGMNVFEYYMMKIHKFRDGKPVFVKDEDGNYDLQKMYDVKFAKVRLYDDPTSEMKDSKNYIDYEKLIKDDPYWINDKDLIDKIYSEEYNFMESKYLGVETMFNLMKIIYESSYYFKMIIDNRALLQRTTVYNNSTHSNNNLFELVIYVCAIISKKYGFEGNIPTDLSSIGKVMGFNFKDDLIKIKENISNDDYLKDDPKLLEYLETMNVSSLESVSKVYGNLEDLRKHIVRKMSETNNIPTYWAYYELYNTIMYSEYTEDVFVTSTGAQASTFSELLADINQTLYRRYYNDDVYDPDVELSDTLYLLQSSCDRLKNLQYADNINIDTIIENLIKLLEFFKSAKADIVGYEVIYSLVSNSDNIMKLMSTVDKITDNHPFPEYSIIDELQSLIVIIEDYTRILDKYKLIDEIIHIEDKTSIKSMIYYLKDMIFSISMIVYDLTTDLHLVDVVKKHEEITLLPKDPFTFGDSIDLLYDEIEEVIQYFVKDVFPISDNIIKIGEILFGNELLSASSISFMTKLMMIEAQEFMSEFRSTDNIMNVKEKAYKGISSNIIFDAILLTFIERENINDSLLAYSIMENIKDIYAKKESGYVLSDNMIDREITKLLNDINANKINYLDRVLDKFIRGYLFDEILADDKLRSCVQYISKEYMEFALDDVMMWRSIYKTHSVFSMKDDITLRYERIYEE